MKYQILLKCDDYFYINHHLSAEIAQKLRLVVIRSFFVFLFHTIRFGFVRLITNRGSCGEDSGKFKLNRPYCRPRFSRGLHGDIPAELSINLLKLILQISISRKDIWSRLPLHSECF